MQSPPASRFGFAAAVGTAATTLAAFVAALATPPVSGALCTEGCLSYPWLDAVSRFPRDYVWMFLALPSNLCFLALAAALHARGGERHRAATGFGLALAAIAAAALLFDYGIQIAAVQPSLIAGEHDGVAMLSQYNPHGVFIALEELGYLAAGLALAALASALEGGGPEKAGRWIFRAGFAAQVAAAVGFAAVLGHARGYLLEVALITVGWPVLIAGAAVTAAVFRRDAR